MPDGKALPALRVKASFTPIGSRDWPSRPDGRTLASAADDCTIKLWDIGQRTQVATLRGTAERELGCLAFSLGSPKGESLVSGSDDLAVKLWDRESGRVRASLEGHAGMPRAIHFSPDGKTLSPPSVRIAICSAGERPKTIKDPGSVSSRSQES